MATASFQLKKDVVEVFDSFDDLDDESGKRVDFNEKNAVQNFLNLRNEKNGPLEETKEPPAEQLKLRNYQEELIIWPLQGYNTIVCAPTGSGKTIVAVKILAEHLRKRVASGEKSKVAFLVPTANLVDQQSEVVKRYLRNEFKIIGIKGGQTGTNQPPKKMIVQRHDVSVMTPQLLLNMMTYTPSENEFSVDDAKIEISDFSLIVFDECHHADKNHSYNEIMNAYFDIKFSKTKNTEETSLPQIVGLTASLGVGQADRLEQARDHVVKICANMDAQKLALIERNLAELEQFVYAPKDELVTVRFDYNNLFSHHIIETMKLIEKQLQPIFNHVEDMKMKHSLSVMAPEKRWSAVYTGWVYGWYHFAPILDDAKMKRELTTYMEHLIVYHNTLELNAHVPTKFAFEYLTEEFEIIIRKQTNELDQRLVKLYNAKVNTLNLIAENPEQRNPIVEKLKNVLLSEYAAKNDSRTLVFVRTRELAKAVERYMNSEKELIFLNAGRLTGVNARKDDGGQTAREQQDFLERFRNGEHKVVVATTVAEEGLDVEKCNVVIKYNHVTNEIALVQRRGRGRAEGSKSILLTHEGWIEQKEMVNMIREKMMNEAIKQIRTKGNDWFLTEIAKREKQAYLERDVEKRQRNQIRKRLGNKTYLLKCKKCDKLMTDSTKIRRCQEAHYVSVDPTIWDGLISEPNNAPKLFENLTVAGKVSCGSCRIDCGIIVKYRNVYLPALKIDNFVVFNPENRQKMCPKKWKQVVEQFFVVEPLMHADLPPMYHGLKKEIEVKLDDAIERAEAEAAAERAAAEEAEENAREQMFF